MPSQQSEAQAQTLAGMAACKALMAQIGEATDAAMLEHWQRTGTDPVGDIRDYGAFAGLIEHCLRQNVTQAAEAHSRGFLLALADLFSLNADGCGAGSDWRPERLSNLPQSSLTQTGRNAQ